MIDTYTSTIKRISESIFGSLVIIYILGFLTYNSYLSAFNLGSADILNIRYISAGIHYIIILGLAIIYSFTFIELYLAEFKNKDIFSVMGKSKANHLLAYGLFLPLVFATSLVEIYKIPNWTLNHKSKINNDIITSLIMKLNPNINLQIINAIDDYVITLVVIASVFVVLHLIKNIWGLVNNSRKISKGNSNKAHTEHKTFANIGNNLLFIVLVTTVFFIGTNSGKSLLSHQSSLSNFNVDPINFLDIYALIFSISIIIIYFYLTLHARKISSFKDIIGLFTDHSYIFIAIIIGGFLWNIFLFGRVIYSKIPYTVGGGKPREIQLKSVNPSTLPDHTDKSKFFLLDSTNNSYFILIQTPGKPLISLEINKTEIEYIKNDGKIIKDN